MPNNIIALSITCLRDYDSRKRDAQRQLLRNPDGSLVEPEPKPMFVYAVDGTQAQLDAYADSQGVHLRTDEATGKLLWFTRKYAGESGRLLCNTDTSACYADMSLFRRQASLAAQFGGNLGNQIAQTAISKLFRMKDTEAPEPAK